MVRCSKGTSSSPMTCSTQSAGLISSCLLFPPFLAHWCFISQHYPPVYEDELRRVLLLSRPLDVPPVMGHEVERRIRPEPWYVPRR